MTQIKIYNGYLRKKNSFYFLWKHEGINFKYFRNKTKQNQFARNPNSLDRIDKAIQKTLKATMSDAEEKVTRLSQ